MDALGFFLLGFTTGLILHAVISHLMDTADINKEAWRGAWQGEVIQDNRTEVKESKDPDPHDMVKRPVIIKTTDEVTMNQRDYIRRNQERGDATNLEDL